MTENRSSHRKRSFFNPRYIRTERRAHTKRGALILLAAIPLFLLFDRYLLSTGVIRDVSMQPTLQEGRYFLIHKYPYLFHSPGRGEIVVFRRFKTDPSFTIKRVIGTGGDAVQISNGTVLVNGRPLEEPYALGFTAPDGGPWTLETGTFFVLGDNRENSQDSRHFGPVVGSFIEGRIRP